MEKQRYLTISIDDGHPADLRTAELLQKFGLKATFYIPAHNPERTVMSPNEIREIAQHFEVGSHTLNHKPLTHLLDREAYLEISDGKKWLEDVLGKDVIAFCYPQGKFNSGIIKHVQQAGFLGARTCMFNLNSFPQNPFLWGVSTHGYSHSMAIQIRHALLEGNFRGLLNFIAVHRLSQDWVEHFGYSVDFVERHGGVAHLYFHSWEIEKHNQWFKLEKLLKSVPKNSGFIFKTNGDLFRSYYEDLFGNKN